MGHPGTFSQLIALCAGMYCDYVPINIDVSVCAYACGLYLGLLTQCVLFLSLSTGCRRQIDVVFVLDMSGSTETSHKWARLAAKEIVTNLDMNFGRVHVGLITYGDNASVHFYLDTYSEKEEILNAICFIPEGLYTML